MSPFIKNIQFKLKICCKIGKIGAKHVFYMLKMHLL